MAINQLLTAYDSEQPPVPESMLGFGVRNALDGLGTVGYALDFMGRPIRRALRGTNPFGDDDPSGRDVLESWGVVGPETGEWDVGDFAGFGLQVGTDPISYLLPFAWGTKGFQAAKQGSLAAKAALAAKQGAAASRSYADDIARSALSHADDPFAAELRYAPQAAEGAAAAEKAAQEAAQFADEMTLGATQAERIRKGQSGLVGFGIPFFDHKRIVLGEGSEAAAKFAEQYWDNPLNYMTKTNPLAVGLRGLWAPRVMNAIDLPGQKMGEAVYDEVAEAGVATTAEGHQRYQQMKDLQKRVAEGATQAQPQPESQQPVLRYQFDDEVDDISDAGDLGDSLRADEIGGRSVEKLRAGMPEIVQLIQQMRNVPPGQQKEFLRSWVLDANFADDEAEEAFYSLYQTINDAGQLPEVGQGPFDVASGTAQGPARLPGRDELVDWLATQAKQNRSLTDADVGSTLRELRDIIGGMLGDRRAVALRPDTTLPSGAEVASWLRTFAKNSKHMSDADVQDTLVDLRDQIDNLLGQRVQPSAAEIIAGNAPASPRFSGAEDLPSPAGGVGRIPDSAASAETAGAPLAKKKKRVRTLNPDISEGGGLSAPATERQQFIEEYARQVEAAGMSGRANPITAADELDDAIGDATGAAPIEYQKSQLGVAPPEEMRGGGGVDDLLNQAVREGEESVANLGRLASADELIDTAGAGKAVDWAAQDEIGEIARSYNPETGTWSDVSPAAANLAKQLEAAVPGVSKEQAALSLAAADAVAETFSARSGITKDEWWGKKGIRIERGDHALAKGVVALGVGSALITAFQKADVTTFLHEFAHIIRPELTEAENALLRAFESTLQKKDYSILGDAIKISGYKGVVDDDMAAAVRAAMTSGTDDPDMARLIDAYRNEKWARGFERHLHTGKAPTPQLESLFRKISDWFIEVYGKLAQRLGSAIPRDAKKVYDGLYTGALKQARKATPRAAPVAAADPWAALSDLARNNLRPRWAAAEESGLAEKIDSSLRSGKMVNEIAAELGVDLDDVNAVRIGRGIAAPAAKPAAAKVARAPGKADHLSTLYNFVRLGQVGPNIQKPGKARAELIDHIRSMLAAKIPAEDLDNLSASDVVRKYQDTVDDIYRQVGLDWDQAGAGRMFENEIRKAGNYETLSPRAWDPGKQTLKPVAQFAAQGGDLPQVPKTARARAGEETLAPAAQDIANMSKADVTRESMEEWAGIDNYADYLVHTNTTDPQVLAKHVARGDITAQEAAEIPARVASKSAPKSILQRLADGEIDEAEADELLKNQPPEPPTPPPAAPPAPDDIPEIRNLPPSFRGILRKMVEKIQITPAEEALLGNSRDAVQQFADQLAADDEALGALARSLGVRGADLKDVMEHFYRFTQVPSGKKRIMEPRAGIWDYFFGPRGLITARRATPTSITPKRSDDLRGWIGGTEDINTALYNFGGDKVTPEMLRWIKSRMGGEFANDKHVNSAAKWISDPKYAVYKGNADDVFFGRDVVNDLHTGKQRAIRALTGAKVIHRTFAEAADVGAGVPLKKAFTDAGLEFNDEVLATFLANNADVLAGKDLAKLEIPADTVAAAARLIKPMEDPEVLKPLLKVLDQATGATKIALTILWPANWVRNAVGGQYMNLIRGAIDPDSLNQAAALVAGKGDPQWLTEMAEQGILDPAGYRGFGSTFTDDLKDLEGPVTWGQQRAAHSKRLAAEASYIPALMREWAAAGHASAGSVELWNRATHYIARRKQGFAPKEAAQSTKLAHYDYGGGLTDFEKKYVRRIIPFWSFARLNAQAMFGELASKPGGLAAQTIKAANLANKDSEIPPWLEGKMAIPIGQSEDGKSMRYISALGLPIEEAFERYYPGDLQRTMQAHASMLHPFIRGPLEYTTGTQLFSGKEMRDLYQYPTSSPELNQLLSSSPLSRGISTVRQLSDERKELPVKALNTLTGVKLTDVDIESARKIAEREAVLRVLEDSPSFQGRRIYTQRPGTQLSPEEAAAYQRYRQR